jgi:hypothetical protein
LIVAASLGAGRCLAECAPLSVLEYVWLRPGGVDHAVHVLDRGRRRVFLLPIEACFDEDRFWSEIGKDVP